MSIFVCALMVCSGKKTKKTVMGSITGKIKLSKIFLCFGWLICSYIGTWRDDKYHGYGIKKWGNGDRYEGEW
jgi:hypothetical protein